MEAIKSTNFRNLAPNFTTDPEPDKTIFILQRKNSVAEKKRQIPSWKKSGVRLQIQGKDLSSTILEERECRL